MVWHRFLSLTVGLTFIVSCLLILPQTARAGDEGCAASSVKLGTCQIVHVDNDGHDVTIIVKKDSPKGDSGGNGSTTPDPPSSPPVSTEPVGPTMPDRDSYTVTMPVTLSDLARFRPDPGTDNMQPNGWMIVGLDTNFYARAQTQIKSGTLLGQPATVRFTPARYAWMYGDGDARTTSTAGTTWAAQGINEFDPTPTSHIYRDPGHYYIDLTIGFAPEYRYAASTEWIPVSGLVWVPANRLEAVASRGAKTVLVEDECTINPSGPGC